MKGKEKDKDKYSKKSKVKEEKNEPIKIDFDGLIHRFVQAPVAPANYSDLSAIKDKLLWLKAPNRGMMPYSEDDADEDPGAELQTYDIEREKISKMNSGVTAYAYSI